jgi:hypothetical protein
MKGRGKEGFQSPESALELGRVCSSNEDVGQRSLKAVVDASAVVQRESWRSAR